MNSEVTPFKRRQTRTLTPTRLLRRFTKPGHIAEIHERDVRAFEAVEFIVFVDGSLLESQMFYGTRLSEYGHAVNARAKQLTDNGWREEENTANARLD